MARPASRWPPLSDSEQVLNLVAEANVVVVVVVVVGERDSIADKILQFCFVAVATV